MSPSMTIRKFRMLKLNVVFAKILLIDEIFWGSLFYDVIPTYNWKDINQWMSLEPASKQLKNKLTLSIYTYIQKLSLCHKGIESLPQTLIF